MYGIIDPVYWNDRRIGVRIFHEKRVGSKGAAGADGICQRSDGGGIHLEPNHSCHGTVRAHGEIVFSSGSSGLLVRYFISASFG